MTPTTLKRILSALTLCALITSASGISLAGTINYVGPDTDPNGMNGWMADDFWYLGVAESNTEDPNTGGALPLFGMPTSTTGNALDFEPTGFEANSDAGTGHVAEIVDSQLNFMIVAKPNEVIDNVMFLESGDTTLTGNGTDLTGSAVFGNIFVDVIEIDGADPNSGPINLTTTMTFVPSGGTYGLATDAGGGPFFNTLWSGGGIIDINQELTDLGIDFQFGATKVNVAIDNTLVATSEAGNSSFIQKSSDGLTIITNIPEPASGNLVLCCLVFGFARRRSS